MNAKNRNTSSTTKSILTTTFTAVATAGLVVAAAWPGLLDAKDPVAINGPSALRILMTPAVTIQGCKLTASAPKRPAAADQPSLVEIKAVNTTDKPVSFEAMLTAMSQSPGSRFARRLVLPTPSWQDSFAVALGPKEAKTYHVTVPGKVFGGKNLITFRVTAAAKAPKTGNLTAALRLPIQPKPARPVR